MDETTLRRVQLTELSILKEFKRVCSKLNIPYFLFAGTLLGAVRHKGFIPWDDDVDVGMIREDYEKFIREAQTVLDKRFFLQTWQTEEGYPFVFAKLRLNDTLFIPYGSNEGETTHQGIWIDIFPFDRCSSKFRKTIEYRLITLIQAMLVGLSREKPWKWHSGFRKCVSFFRYLVGLLVGKFFSRALLFKYFEKISKKHNTKETSSCFSVGFVPIVVPRSCLAELTEIQFEDDVFLAPKDFTTFLQYHYGDFMKLPPVEKRQGHHNIVTVKFESEQPMQR